MANIRKSGKTWQVVDSRTGKVLRSGLTRAGAMDAAKAMHKKNKNTDPVRVVK